LRYPDDLLKELDYTVCSIHSRFGLGKAAQTERIMRAMDNRYFNILGHATGRLLLKRPGYEIDIDRIITHARQNGCFFEINSSPDVSIFRRTIPAPPPRPASWSPCRPTRIARGNSGLSGMGWIRRGGPDWQNLSFSTACPGKNSRRYL
jgi:hypothetical protein